MIPKRIHFVWIGPEMPEWAERNIEEFRGLNPGYELRLHGEEVLLPRYRAIYGELTDLCTKSDLLRYSALQRYGGWYFDCDFWPMRPLDDLVRAHALDGTAMFLTEQHHQRNPALKIANGVIGAASGCRAWEEIDRAISAARAPVGRVSLGPQLMTDVRARHPRLFRLGAWPWFYPAPRGRAGRLYRACLSGDGRCLARVAPTGGQLPFVMHLWAGGKEEISEDSQNVLAHIEGRPGGRFAGLRVCMAVMDIQWQDLTQCFRALAEGLAQVGCDVTVASLADLTELETTELLVVWNGRKGQYRAAADCARRHGIPTIFIEHGFFDRRAHVHVDSQGILHWASWANDWDRPAPPDAAERLARVWPHRLREFGRRDGYILVIGQVDGDSQMDESELKHALQLEKMVYRSERRGVEALFRPHSLGRPKRVDYLPRCEAPTLLEAVEGARFAVMINSNSGNECLALGCPILAFGPALYLNAGVARQASLASFQRDLDAMLGGWRPDGERVRSYLHWLACRQHGQEELRRGQCLIPILERALT